jgi:type II secretory pathway pseudopilin PulG
MRRSRNSALAKCVAATLAALMPFLFAVPASSRAANSVAGQSDAPQTAPSSGDVSTTLANALSAACRHDVSAFSTFLTATSAAAYRKLDPPQQIAFLTRIVQLQDNGVPLLSTSTEGRPILRCETKGLTGDFRFGVPRPDENLVYIPVQLIDRSVDFGLVRTASGWKLVSLGLVVLDVPQLTVMWQHEDLQAREDSAISALRNLASAIDSYQRAFERLPESLAELGPAPKDGISPAAAGLISAELAGGRLEGYAVRYRIVPPANESHAAAFELAATPTDYPKSAVRSFFIDSTGVLRAADKHGAPATVADPPLDAGQL